MTSRSVVPHHWHLVCWYLAAVVIVLVLPNSCCYGNLVETAASVEGLYDGCGSDSEVVSSPVSAPISSLLVNDHTLLMGGNDIALVVEAEDGIDGVDGTMNVSTSTRSRTAYNDHRRRLADDCPRPTCMKFMEKCQLKQDCCPNSGLTCGMTCITCMNNDMQCVMVGRRRRKRREL